MQLSDKAQEALNQVVARFQSGDLSAVVEVVRLRRQAADAPSQSWSLSNQVLAYIQTHSLDCRGYRQWEQVGRQVRKGARAAWILAPITILIENEDGEKVSVVRGFKSVPVFAVHDTDGKPLPQVDYTPPILPPLSDVARKLGVTVAWQPTPADRLGDCDLTGQRIRVGTHDAQVFFHELAHAAHARLNGHLRGGQHADQETIAEFTACVLMQLYGLGDRSGNAWRYIRSYNSDPIRAIAEALTTVEKVLEVLGV